MRSDRLLVKVEEADEERGSVDGDLQVGDARRERTRLAHVGGQGYVIPRPISPPCFFLAQHYELALAATSFPANSFIHCE